MAKNKKIIVELDGDTTGLQKKLNQAEDSIGKFGKQAGGSMGNAASSISSGIGRVSGGFTGLVGIAGIATTAITGLALKLNDSVRELNQLSKQSGMTVSDIQKLNKTFRESGLGMEKLLDINQDVKDKMGEGFATGGGEFATTIKEIGGNLEEYTQYLNKPNGGIEATLHLMDAMTKAGKSSSEITFALEAIGSDASRLYTRYQELGSAAAVLNDMQSQTAAVTDDTAAAFLQFDKNLDSMSTTGQTFLYDFITPVIEEMNDLYDLVNKDWTGSDFMQMLYRGADNFLMGGKGFIPDTLKKMMGKDSLDSAFISGSVENDFVNASRAGYEANKDRFKSKANTSAPTRRGWVDPKEAEKALKAQQAAARKAEAEAAKAAAKRIQAERALEVALSQVAENAGEQRLQVFDRQQKELLKTIQDTAKTLGKSTAEIEAMLERAKQAGKRARDELINSMIGYSNPNQDLIDANNIAGMGINQEQSNFLSNQQNQRLGNNPFATDNTQQLLDENSQREQLELQINEKLLQSTEEFEKRKQEIQTRYAAQAMSIAQQNTQAQMSVLAGAAGDMGTILEGVFGEGNKAAAAAFAVQRGINMAKIMMNIQVALSEAMATPFPANIANYAQVASMGAQLIGAAKGINIQGQAHSGIEEVPGSLGKDSTWILQAGERVVSRDQNQQLQQFLDNNSSNSSNTGETIVNAPLIIQGNVDGGDDKKFNEMLKKHSQSVNQAVRDAQKRST
ncbi:TPA: hypothetical protein SLE00_001372 [Citrobacter koseri]|uniref:hypothetical protein n=1 Tax=Citrobacter koseri TaxID=545 RepID=UPI0029C374C4|nr:hypothetical protein [Citrobacter koseri]